MKSDTLSFNLKHKGRMVAGRPPKGAQNQEAVELLEQLKKKLGCSNDQELASKLSKHFTEQENPIARTQISIWRTNGIPKNVKGLIQTIIYG